MPKPELLLVSPQNGALLVKQEKAVLVEEGTLVVDEIVIGADRILNTFTDAESTIVSAIFQINIMSAHSYCLPTV